jgi:hypothetical protein
VGGIGPTVFRASTFDPNAAMHGLYFAPSRLVVYEREIQVMPTRLAVQLRLATGPFRYNWPVVVMEPIGSRPRSPSILVEISGNLGSVGVASYRRGQLLDALEAAKFEVIEVPRGGWFGPKPVARETMSNAIGRVPPCVLAD